MTDKGFLRLVHEAFTPFLESLGFSMDDPHISGRYYRASFTAVDHAVFVYYEPGDDALSVIIFRRDNGNLSDIDNRSQSPRLQDLNRRYMHLVTKEDLVLNEEEFEGIDVEDEMERQLLKSAKELRLVLPRYLKETRKQ